MTQTEKFVFAALCFFSFTLAVAAQPRTPRALEARILQLEDERNLNGDELTKLLKHAAPRVRHRAAIALGRIGDERGVAPLLAYLDQYKDEIGRPLVIFALGESESAQAAAPLLALIARHDHLDVEAARAAEALGKIGSVPANLPLIGEAALERINRTIIKLLPVPDAKLSASQVEAAGWCITALLRLRSPLAVAPLMQQLQSVELTIRAQAANALARIRLPINEAVPALIAALGDNINHDLRANAARALGASNDPRAIEPLINSLNDKSVEVEITAIRSLAQLNDARAIKPILQLFEPNRASTINVLLEAAAALTALKAKQALPALLKAREAQAPKRWLEFEIAAAKLSEDPASSLRSFGINRDVCTNWKDLVIANQVISAWLPTENAGQWERTWYDLFYTLGPQTNNPKCDQRSVPSWLQAVSKLVYHPEHKSFVDGLPTTDKNPYVSYQKLFAGKLEDKDLHIRAAAASILGAQTLANSFTPLIKALALTQSDEENDAKLAILSALAKYKTEPAVAAIKTALKDRDILVRRHAVTLLKQLDAGDFSAAIGIVQTGRNAAFYQSVVAQSRQKFFVTITTDKGTIKLELDPQDAPLTVHNFVTLARKGYFNGLTFHRVVPNFVVQGGDPRGTGDGGPSYAIRCEINTRPYVRGAVGMALSGKDTGGSQWFITHALQPHLDGGYTVFGQVVAGMNVVDRITRDDVMRKVIITHQ
jgi:cyclophilin family peptidyl-prolyl cis-trans isomerase